MFHPLRIGGIRGEIARVCIEMFEKRQMLDYNRNLVIFRNYDYELPNKSVKMNE